MRLVEALLRLDIESTLHVGICGRATTRAFWRWREAVADVLAESTQASVGRAGAGIPLGPKEAQAVSSDVDDG